MVVPAALGLSQVFGGLNPDGSALFHTRLALRADGDTLRIQTAALAARPDTAPLRVSVWLDGEALGAFDVPRDGLGEARFELPAHVSRGDAVELLLVPDSWTVTRDAGYDQPAAYRLLRAAIE